jgi:hypothetical protein
MNSEPALPRSRGRFFASAICFCVFASLCSATSGSAQSEPKGAAGPAAPAPASAQSEGRGGAAALPKSAAGEARGEPAGNAAGGAEYLELIEQALSEFKHKNWPEARVHFRRAHELNPNARTLRGMGVVSYEMRDYVQAVIALSAALVDARQPLTDAQKKECSALLARARTFIGSYDLALEPARAEVTVDGAELVRDADGRVLVAFGEHTLQASAPGFQSSTSKLAVQGGEHGELRIVLYRAGETADGQGATPLGRVEKTVEQPPSDEASPAAASDRRDDARFMGGGLRYTWVALGASAAFGGAAAAVWFSGERKLDDLTADCEAARAQGSPCRRGALDVSTLRRFERSTNALLGLSAVSLATAALLATFEWPRERKLALDVGPRRLSLRGSF